METNIIFIVLNSAVKSHIVCELAEKCYLNDKRVIIYIDREEECNKIDNVLWTWKQHSFVPHKCVNSLSSSHTEAVILTTEIKTVSDYDTLLMFDPVPLDIINQFSLAIDFAEKYDKQAIALSRERYKLYRDQKLRIDTMQPGEFLHTAFS